MASPDAFPGKLSPFRTGFLKVELLIGGVWTDVTNDLGDTGITLTRGRSDETTQPEPSRMTLTLNNAGGKYSPRNPSSPYFGKIGRNTQIRVSTQPTAGGTVFYRFWGEVSEWPQRWTRRGTAYAPIECSGLMRRLLQGASPLRSPLYRTLTSSTGSADLIAYWPMEDGTDATQFAAGMDGVKPLTWTGTLNSLAGYAGFRGSEALPMIGTAVISGRVPARGTQGIMQTRWLTAIPVSTPNGAVLLRIQCDSSLRVDISYVTGGSLKAEAFFDGSSIGSTTAAFALTGVNKVRLSWQMVQNGASIDWTFGTVESGATSGLFVSGSWAGGAFGKGAKLIVNPGGVDLAGMPIGHVTVEDAITSLFSVSGQVMNGFFGETAADRITRLCSENGIPFVLVATDASDTAKLGAQGVDTLMNLLREAAITDGGFLYENRLSYSLVYRTRESQYLKNQTAVAITYRDNLLRPFEPTDDDQAVRNVVTVERRGGSSSTARDDTSTMGTTAIGVYDESVTLSLQTDDQAARQASWRVHVGTVDEARWPVIGLDLADSYWFANTALRDAVLGASMGSWVRVTNLPAWLPPYPVDALVQGYTERIGTHEWTLEFGTAPASPYRVAFWSSTQRYSGEGTVLSGSLSSSATTFTTTNPVGVKWTSADGPYDIVINGEQMTVTAVTGGNAFTVTRSVNGVVKSHASGSAVALAEPCYYGV